MKYIRKDNMIHFKNKKGQAGARQSAASSIQNAVFGHFGFSFQEEMIPICLQKQTFLSEASVCLRRHKSFGRQAAAPVIGQWSLHGEQELEKRDEE